MTAPGPGEDWLALVERVREGDRVALLRITTLVTGYLTRFGAYDHRDAWDDVCQEVILKLLRSVEEGTIRNPRAFVGYTGTVTRNTLVDWIRKNAKPGRSDAPDGEDGDLRDLATALRGQEEADLAVDLARAVAALPEDQRSVLEAVYIEGRSYAEAAEHLGLPLGTLKRHQTQGLKALRVALGLSGDEL